ncbi:MAG: uroporphyrinogen-III C-methyltransferase [Dehalococcoidia bacterium]
MSGKVWMVGAGPGDPELITVRGRDALANADVIVYDDAVNPDFLHLAPDSAEVLNAGSRPLLHQMMPAEITGLLVERARAGKQVVRLLGGDPFVLGPGVRESEAVAAAGVPFEIVPGVTSSVAAPAYAGIPVLHPDLARSYAVLAGDATGTAPESLVDWSKLATAVDTLVFVGARDNLPALAQRLVAHGCAPETPAAVVSWGTDTRQITVVGTVADIAERVEDAGLAAPAVTVVGDVVRLREQLRWYDDRPLHGRRVLLARTRHGASEIKRLLQAEGAEVVELPTQEIVDTVAPEIIGRVADALVDGQYSWAIFSSGRAVDLLFRRLAGLGRDARSFHATQVLAAGQQTVDALAGRGILTDVQVENPVTEDVLAALRGHGLSRRRVLLPRAEEAQRDLLKGLRDAGAEVEEVPLYVASVPHEPNRAALGLLKRGEIDAVVFPASIAVTNLIKMLRGNTEPLRHATIACVTPVSVAVANDAGLHVDVAAQPATPAGIVRALGDFIARRGPVHVAAGAHRS